MKTTVQILREERNLTQVELAERSGLSLRTIQRLEAGSPPKGYTLRAISNILETTEENLKSSHVKNDEGIERAKLINISAISAIIIPFGNLIFPALLTYKSKQEKAKKIGKEILSIQIIYSFILGILLIISPFIQKEIPIKLPVFIVILIMMNSINLYIIFKNGSSLNQTKDLSIKLKNSTL